VLATDPATATLERARRALLSAFERASSSDPACEHRDLFLGGLARTTRTRARCERISHLVSLAGLADRCARALNVSDPAHALLIAEEQAELLRTHAGACLRELALELEQIDSTPFHAGLGSALRELVEHDLVMIERSAQGERFIAIGTRRVFCGSGEVLVERYVMCPEQGETVSMECCKHCGRWDGTTLGDENARAFITCRRRA
jgi:hypothetical protein